MAVYIYNSYDKSFVKFASIKTPLVTFGNTVQYRIQLIDEAWVQIGGVSYSNHFESKQEFHTRLVQHLLAGKMLDEIENSLISPTINKE